MDEDNDRVALVRNPSKQQEAQKFVVSDEVTHIEERTKRMGDLEVQSTTKIKVLAKQHCSAESAFQHRITTFEITTRKG